MVVSSTSLTEVGDCVGNRIQWLNKPSFEPCCGSVASLLVVISPALGYMVDIKGILVASVVDGLAEFDQSACCSLRSFGSRMLSIKRDISVVASLKTFQVNFWSQEYNLATYTFVKVVLMPLTNGWWEAFRMNHLNRRCIQYYYLANL